MPRRALLRALGVASAAVLAGCSRVQRHPDATATAADTATKSSPSPSRAATESTSKRPSASPHLAAVEYANGPRSRAQVALTFHGAGDPALAHDLLSVLAERAVPVTVFAVGSWLEANPTIAPQLVAAGHELGNHTHHHLDIDSLAAAAAQAEIIGCRQLLQAQVGQPGRYFRPSQAQHASPLVLRLAGEAGYPVCVSYDVDSLDYTDPGPAVVRRQVATARNGSVISLHFGHLDTVRALPAILDDLAARHLSPVTVSALLSA